MDKVNYFTFKDEQDGDLVVIVEIGCIASTYHNGESIRTEYYQSRIEKDTQFENIWDELGEGKMYGKTWSEHQEEDPTDEELIADMLDWLYVSTGAYELVENKMGEFTEENFNKAKLLLKLEV